jgi:2-polyprenyl-6-methoxyphenol hydroxylase-like FAD-dependent oxidoreductase
MYNRCRASAHHKNTYIPETASMDNHFNRIVVLGGGTAGWMAALAIATGQPRAGVTLVESEEVGTVGVGEATFPSIRAFHDIVGVDEASFLRATNGTYKLGIQFCDWREPGSRYVHTFGDVGALDGANSVWSQYHRLYGAASAGAAAGSFDEQFLPNVMAMQNRFCLPAPERGARYNYAYQFDATLYARFLRDMAVQRGVTRVEGKVVDVARRPDGAVASLRLADGREIAGDLFVDCSGFASVLLGRTLEEPFVDFSHWLPVDRAWACPSERTGGPLVPYTRATALEAGWAWRIPLRNRTGNGHVFASRYIDEERARDRLMAQMDGAPLAEPRLLRFTTGHRSRFWVGNVVALGLASGFLEPLESTSIYLVQCGLGRLMTLLEGGQPVGEDAVRAYNKGLVRQFERVRDFIIMHYCLSARDDTPFWRDMRAMAIPETLAFKLHAWRQTGVLHQYDEESFEEGSWLMVHAGMGHWPERWDPRHAELPAEAVAGWLEQRRRQTAQVVATLPTHEAFLAHVLGDA